MRYLLSSFILVAALAACGGGGGGSGASNVMPPPPVATAPPTTPPATASPPPALQAKYPGSGGNLTVDVIVQKSQNAGVVETGICGYRDTDSQSTALQLAFCTKSFAPPAQGVSGVQGDWWKAPTNHVDYGTYFIDTYQLSTASGGSMGSVELVHQDGSAALATGMVMSSPAPSGAFQVLTSTDMLVGQPCTPSSTNVCPTVSSLGGTVGGFEYNVYCVSDANTCATPLYSGGPALGTLYTMFLPSEVYIISGGEAYFVPHSTSPPFFGTGTDVTKQGFTVDGRLSNVRAIDCPSAAPCTPDQTVQGYPTSWGIVQSGNRSNIQPPYLPPGDVFGTSSSFPSACYNLLLFSSPNATSGGIELNVTQVRQVNSDGTSHVVVPPSGVEAPEWCATSI